MYYQAPATAYSNLTQDVFQPSDYDNSSPDSSDQPPSTIYSSSLSPDNTSHYSTDWTDPTDGGSQDSWTLVPQTTKDPACSPLLHQSLTLTALTDLHTSLFEGSYLPRNSYAISEPIELGTHPANWTQHARCLINNDPSLRYAFLALSSSRIGRDNQDDDLVASAKHLYGEALREMQRALSDPRRRNGKETLMACSILGLYEVYETQHSEGTLDAPNTNAWLSHLAAVTRLLEARGPTAYTTGLDHQMFLHLRILTIVRASSGRKACFLAEPRWQTVPWQKHPKNMQHQLIDIMAYVPMAVETYDHLKTNSTFSPHELRHERKMLLNNCVMLSEQSRRWYSRLRMDMNGKPLWHATVAEDPSYPFSFLFSFDDPTMGYTLMLFWTCQLILQGHVADLHRLLNKHISDPRSREPLPPQINPQVYAVNIAQSLTYFAHPDFGALGPTLALFPMGMAFGYFATPMQPAFTADRDWMHNVTSEIGDLMEGRAQDSPSASRTSRILSWYIRLFSQLGQRSMPGGTFLSTLMRDLGHFSSNAVHGAAVEM